MSSFRPILLLIPDARMNNPVNNIRDEVSSDNSERYEVEHRLHDRVVLHLYGLKEPEAESRPCEDSLSYDRTGKNATECERASSYHRERSVLERVTEEYHSLRQPLRSGC